MADVELINLVTTRLVQDKKEVEYELKSLMNESTRHTNLGVITKTLDNYSKIINQLKRWESLINDITPEENNKDGENK